MKNVFDVSDMWYVDRGGFNKDELLINAVMTVLLVEQLDENKYILQRIGCYSGGTIRMRRHYFVTEYATLHTKLNSLFNEL